MNALIFINFMKVLTKQHKKNYNRKLEKTNDKPFIYLKIIIVNIINFNLISYLIF